MHILSQKSQTVKLLDVSGRNESGAYKNNVSEEAFCETKEYVWQQNKDYVEGATC